MSGKFLLDPVYKTYPFDAQRFSIHLRPKKGEFPFIVQPMQKELRDKTFDIEGWDTRDAYVTYDRDFVSVSIPVQPNTCGSTRTASSRCETKCHWILHRSVGGGC